MADSTRNYSPTALLARLSTDEAFTQAHSRAARIAGWSGRVSLWGLGLWVGSAAVLMCFTLWFPGTVEESIEKVPYVLVALLALSGCGGMLTAIAGAFTYFHFSEQAQGCKPLTGTHGCVAAARLTSDFLAARRIRNEALAQHRQLYFADLHAMEDATSGCQPETSTEALKEACAKLHQD